MSEIKEISVEGLPTAKLKERYLVIVINSEKEFEELSKNANDNPGQRIYIDNEKSYFYNETVCHIYFHNEERKKWLK